MYIYTVTISKKHYPSSTLSLKTENPALGKHNPLYSQDIVVLHHTTNDSITPQY